MESYTNYKDSGVEWLGDIPEHWGVMKLKYLIENKLKYGANEEASLDDRALPRYIRITDFTIDGNLKDDTFKSIQMDIAKKYLLSDGDILFARSGTVGKTFFFKNYSGLACHAGYLIKATPSKKINNAFLYYFTTSTAYQNWKNRHCIESTIQNISAEKYANLFIPIPPLSEQQAIANYLDQKTAQIARFIENKKKLIQLLEEEKKAVITQAVTKGLDATVKFKPSGVEWLGDIPEHWGVRRTKLLFRLIVEPAEVKNNFELLSIYTDIGVKPRKELDQKGNKASTTDGYWKVKKGDFIVNKLLAWMGAIGLSEYDGVTSPAYDILRKKIQLDNYYYNYLFRCGILLGEIKRYSKGIMEMRLRLYFDEFGKIFLPIPPFSEQQAIANHIETQTQKIDTLIEKYQKEIDLITEYRQRLIYDVVTGKIKLI